MSHAPLFALVLAAIAFTGARASACEKLPYEEHVLDTAAHPGDTEAPAALKVESIKLERIAKGETKNGSCSQSYAMVVFAPPEDDHTDTADVGVRFEVVSSEGTVPAGLLALLDGKTLRTLPGPSNVNVAFQFMDDEQLEPFRLEVSAQGVDLTGNVGPATTVVIESEESGGCASMAGGLWLLLPLALLRRR